MQFAGAWWGELLATAVVVASVTTLGRMTCTGESRRHTAGGAVVIGLVAAGIDAGVFSVPFTSLS